MITEDHNHKRGEGMEKFGQTEGAQKGNTHSEDQLSRGDSRDDIFIDHLSFTYTL